MPTAARSIRDVKANPAAVVELNLDGQRRKALPQAVRQCSALRILSLQENGLAELPDWIGELATLEELNLGGNELSALPESVTVLRRLRILTAGGNALASLPETIGELEALERLGLPSNALVALPDGMGDGVRRHWGADGDLLPLAGAGRAAAAPPE